MPEWKNTYLLLDRYSSRGDYDRSLDKLHEVIILHPNNKVAFAARYLAAQTYKQLGKQRLAFKLLDESLSANVSELDLMVAELEISRLHYLNGNLKSASSLYPEQSVLKYRRFQVSPVELIKKSDLEPGFWNEPILYGLSSALLPGLGQALAGSPMDSLSSLLMIGIPLHLSISAKRNNEHAFAAGSGIIAGIFYLGGISSSMKIKRKSNELKQKAFLKSNASKIYPYIKVDILPFPSVRVIW